MPPEIQAKSASNARGTGGSSYEIDSKSPLPEVAPATLAQALTAAQALGLDRLDAQLLLLHTLGRPPHERAWLLAHDTDALPASAWPAFAARCARRAAGEPVAYLLGEKEFHGLTLRVDARVLVPRPDTETLVDWALERLAAGAAPAPHQGAGAPDQPASAATTATATATAATTTAAPPPAPRVLDLGTGSGAIALALQHARPDAQVDAIDASADALAVARANAERLGLPVRLAQGDWLQGAARGYTLIVSNPPYIAAGDAHLAALRHEPLDALAAGPDGLADLRRIVQDAPAHLADGGWLLLEHGHDQAEAVRALLVARGLAEVQSRDDLAGIARCSGGCWRTVK